MEADGKRHVTPWVISGSYGKEGHGQTAGRRNRLWKDRCKRGKKRHSYQHTGTRSPFSIIIPYHLMLSNRNSPSLTHATRAFSFKIEVVSLITRILLILIRGPVLKIPLSRITHSLIYLLYPLFYRQNLINGSQMLL